MGGQEESRISEIRVSSFCRMHCVIVLGTQSVSVFFCLVRGVSVNISQSHLSDKDRSITRSLAITLYRKGSGKQ